VVTKKTIIIVGVVVAAIGGGVGYYFYQQQQAQEEHFQDCRNRILAVSDRMIRLMTHASSLGGHFDISGVEAAANMDDELSRLLFAECSDVSERLQQDPAIKTQRENASQLARDLGLIQ
jgi:hypothetical protein